MCFTGELSLQRWHETHTHALTHAFISKQVDCKPKPLLSSTGRTVPPVAHDRARPVSLPVVVCRRLVFFVETTGPEWWSAALLSYRHARHNGAERQLAVLPASAGRHEHSCLPEPLLECMHNPRVLQSKYQLPAR